MGCPLEKLVAMSNKYGRDSRYVLAGGGNTSYKDEKFLYVKGSGTALATIQAENFVVMYRDRLDAMLVKDYPSDDAAREKAVLEDMMAARLETEYHKRPSVEAILHNLFRQSYVLHLHPALVNGLTCGQDGKALTDTIFGSRAVWIDLEKPGYLLSAACFSRLNEYRTAKGCEPQIVLLENHGIFVAADSTEEIDAIMDEVMSKLTQRLVRQPDFSTIPFDREAAATLAPVLRMSYSPEGKACATFFTNSEVNRLVASPQAFKPVAGLFTPDHIVYCKAALLYMRQGEDAAAKMQAFEDAHGFKAKIVAVEGLGVFALGKDMKEAQIAKNLWLDSVAVAAYAESFGGYRHLPDCYVDFIANWETENYRQKVSLGGAEEKRLAGKISIVTGSAQGFGKGIALEMAREGAYLVIADMNYEGAKAFAQELNDQYGQDTAIPVMVNVTDEENVQKMIDDTVLHFGGLDVFVNNAGIAKPGSLEEMEKKLFELITSVNYTAYFLCAKYASRVMKLQHKAAPDYMMDIIEVNSKSGLEGSNKNFAYAGSKFGGVGLTQSFAMELTDYNIKVNAICPGNYFDGPLWSDPEKGLFKLYLEAGKIPGAKTVADVKKAYEAKIPMGRGCLPLDVARAIFYCVEQKYETGQAIPVTGGQVMLK